MHIACPSCQADVSLTSSFPAEGLLTCPQCGHKFRLVVEQPRSVTGLEDVPVLPAKPALRREEQKPTSPAKPPEPDVGFAAKAGWAVVGLIVLVVLVYVAWRWWMG